jgi:hypothetical protein
VNPKFPHAPFSTSLGNRKGQDPNVVYLEVYHEAMVRNEVIGEASVNLDDVQRGVEVERRCDLTGSKKGQTVGKILVRFTVHTVSFNNKINL